MKTLLIAITVAGLTACASAAPAPQAVEQTARAVTAQNPAEIESSLQPGDPGYWDEEVCRREPVTGTRLTRARCHTRYDWARMSGAATETMRDIDSQSITCPRGGCGTGN
jgi:hypothetical protein